MIIVNDNCGQMQEEGAVAYIMLLSSYLHRGTKVKYEISVTAAGLWTKNQI